MIPCSQLLEEFIFRVQDLLWKFEQLHDSLTTPELPDDLGRANRSIEDHNLLNRKIQKAPVEMLDAEGQKILQRIFGSSRHKG